MAYKKISEFPAASSVAGSDELILNQGGTTRRGTVDQVSKAIGGKFLLGSQVASNSPSLDFTSLITSLFDEYHLHFGEIIPATDAVDLLLRTSSNNGSSWDSGASDYVYSTRRDSAAAAEGVVESTGANGLAIISGSTLGNAANENASGIIRLMNPLFTGGYKTIFWDCGYYAANASPTWLIGGGARASATAMNAVQLLASSGNITSGWARLYGIKK